MERYALEEPATAANFDEAAYLAGNPDVAAALRAGKIKSARQHFNAFGEKEGRRQRRGAECIAPAKRRKLDRIRPILRSDMPHVEREGHFDFLTSELADQFHIDETEAVSHHDYDAHVMRLIERHEDGLVLDCGAGRRPVYYGNVVNFEIVPYETTDVRGVAEKLPFLDASFDAVISMSVLEHLKDPFLSAREMTRVLKKGGELICCVPFLQPYHGYPHHYYNMTHQGLRNLFDGLLEVDDVKVYDSVLPIWALTWIVQSWANGLQGRTREEFLRMRLSDLMASPQSYLQSPFVTQLPRDKNYELAAASVLFAHRA